MDEADGTARVYEYDELYRLTKETVTGAQTYENSFTYDAVSNRKTQTTTGAVVDAGVVDAADGVDAGMSGARTINYSYDNRDRLTSEDGTVYSWSENGNLVGRTGDGTMEWDWDDRLTKVTKPDGTVIENLYDVDGVLVRTSVTPAGGSPQITDLLVDTNGGLSHVVAEIDGSGAVAALYVRAGDMLLEEIRGGLAKMYEADGLGSTRSLLDTTGAQTDTWSYEAFGTMVASTGTSVSPYRFAGERWVAGVGMYQNRARWLDMRTGRFVSVDPEESIWEEPVTAHPYVYCANSPVIYLDGTGRFFGGVAELGIANIVAGTMANTQFSVGMATMDQIEFGGSAGYVSLAVNLIAMPIAGIVASKLIGKTVEFVGKSVLFGQGAISNVFAHGPFQGRTLGWVVKELRAGRIHPDQLPINYVVRNGEFVTVNNRTLAALRRAGLQPTKAIDRTGDRFFEDLVEDHLRGLSPSDVIRIRGGAPNASFLD